MSDVPPDIDPRELVEYVTEVSDELLDAIIFRLHGVERMSHAQVAHALAEGVVFRDVVVCHKISRSQVWRRWKDIIAAEGMDQETMDEVRAGLVVVQNNALRVACQIMENPKVAPRARVSAVLAVDRAVRTLAELQGANAPKRISIEPASLDELRARAERILVERQVIEIEEVAS